MARPPRSLLPCWALLPSLLLLLLGYLPAASPAPSRLRLLWPRVPSDRPRHPAWLTTEVPFCDAPKPRLTGEWPLPAPAGQLGAPRALPRRRPDTPRLTGGPCGPASPAEPHRRKRRAAARLPRAAPQLMRVGCALGTCQVQHLRHRLWQLQGRPRGRDSSPVDPGSPHSYG